MAAPQLSYILNRQHPGRRNGAILLLAAAVLITLDLHLAGWVCVGLGMASLQPRYSWVLAETWSTRVNGTWKIRIPTGFRFDLASIPRVLWWIPGLAPFELATTGPLLHDWLYVHRGKPPIGTVIPIRDKPFTRRYVDRYFRELMAVEGIGPIRRWVAWSAVRAFGWWAWIKE